MTIDKQLFTHLEEAAQKLNTESDSLNSVFDTLNERLAKMRLGLTLYAFDVCDGDVYEHCTNENQCIRGHEAPEQVNRYDATRIGYTKLADQWCIVARPVTYELRLQTHTGTYEYEIVDTERPVSIVNAARNVRIEAAGRIDELLRALLSKAEQYAANTEKAREALA